MDLERRRFDSALPFEELLGGVNKFRPDVFRGIGSHLGAFLRWVADTGRHLEKPRAVTYDADAMPKADRRVIEHDLGIPVISAYEAVEALRIGFQCEARQGFHVSLDQAAVRVVGPDGADVGPGERGELILTNLINRAMVVIHYRLGDLVMLGSGRCICGRTFPLIQDIDGRLDDLVVRPGGSRIHALSFLGRLQAVAGVQQIQVIQEDFDAFRLQVVWTRGAHQRLSELVRAMTEVLGHSIRVAVEPIAVLAQEPSGKVKSVHCRVRVS